MSYYLPEYEDSALFVGIVKAQTDKNIRTFFDNEFKNENGLFSKYKNGLIEHSDPNKLEHPKEKESLKGFYEPEGYILFGDADLAVISQVDDFMFSGHLFHPTHPFKTEHEDAKFYYDYQTITGYTPKFSLNNNQTLNAKWNSFYNLDQKKIPLIAITRIKLNSALTVGVGKKVNSLITFLIKTLISQKNNENSICDFFLIESFCSYEFTLISFSNSIKVLTELILSLREHSLRSLIELINAEDTTNSDLKKIVNDIEHKSLMSFWINNSGINSSKKTSKTKQLNKDINNLSIIDSHLFTKTQTTFGYHIDYYGNQTNFHKIQDISKVEFTVSFNIKPGHLNSFLMQMNSNSEFLKRFNETNIISGNSVLNYKYNSDDNYPIPSFDTFYPKSSKISNPVFDPTLNVLSNLNKIRTSFTIKTNAGNEGINLNDIEKQTNKHLKVTEKLKDLTFSRKQLEDIHKWLKKIGVSKVLQTRLQKMYGNYNDHIQDSILHIYFVDLLLYLKWIYNILHDYANLNQENYSLSDIHITLNELINNFEHAFKNKHHQTYLEQNATDNNLEYAGGLHQIIVGYEAFFRVVQSGMNFDIEKNAIAYVSGEPDVDSDAYAVRLNYYHLYNVQHFMGIIIKEASNFYFPSNSRLASASKLELNKEGFESLSFLKLNIDSYTKIKAIREELSNIIKFSYEEKDEVITFLYNNINNSLFQYILSDFINFYYASNADIDLFVYWHLSLFLQNPTHYSGNRDIVDKNIWHTLLRMNIIKITEEKFNTSHKKYDSVITNHLSTLINVKNIPTLIDTNKKIHGFCESLFQSEKFSNWVKSMHKETIHFFINEKNPSLKEIERVKVEFLKQGQDRQNAYNFLKEQSTLGLKKKMEKYKREFNINLIEKKYTEYKDDYSAFVLAIINSVLIKLKEFNHNSIQILSRDNYGIPIHPSTKARNIKLINDPFGGIFIRGHNNRIEFFKFRREVLNTMMDFALKIKIELYKTRIEINKTKKDPYGGDLF